MNNQERAIPQSIEAEAAILGAALYDANAYAVVVTQLTAQDFYRPSHRSIYTAMIRMWERGDRRAEGVIVADELKAMGELEAVGGPAEITTLMANAPGAGSVDRYAGILQERTLARQVLQAGTAITDMAYGESDVTKMITDTKSLIERLDMPMGVAPPSPNIMDFLQQETTTDWLVPGLIERGDRLMLTAAEGAGKSTLIRQMGVQIASGIHPWRHTFINPCRVLVIDVENSVPQIQRALRPLTVIAGENLDPDNFRIEVKTEGLDLTNRHDARWLFERVAVNRPDIVTIGPVYKLHASDPIDEMPARAVAKVLDEIRSRYGCALFIEAHSAKGGGKRSLMPFGASLWLRWPEFGYGIRATKADPNRFKFEEWRGPRDVREWPEAIRRGGKWLWTAEPRQERAF